MDEREFMSLVWANAKAKFEEHFPGAVYNERLTYPAELLGASTGELAWWMQALACEVNKRLNVLEGASERGV